MLDRQNEFATNSIKDSYNKGGMNGQNLLVLPSENRVVGWQGYDIHPGGPDFTKSAAEYKSWSDYLFRLFTNACISCFD